MGQKWIISIQKGRLVVKCKDCDCCHKVTHLRYVPQYGLRDVEVYECWGVREPFEIKDINTECTEYPEKREQKAKASEIFKSETNYLRFGTEDCGLEITPEDIVFLQNGKRKTWSEMLEETHIDNVCPCCGRKL